MDLRKILTYDVVNDIKEKREEGLSAREIAEYYGIHVTSVYRALNPDYHKKMVTARKEKGNIYYNLEKNRKYQQNYKKRLKTKEIL